MSGQFPEDAIMEKGFDATYFAPNHPMGIKVEGSETPGHSAVYKSGMYPGQSFLGVSCEQRILTHR